LAPLLQVNNLKTYFYGDHSIVKAVNDVSFDVRHGETLAIVGESGSGKSVTAMSILRLIPNPPGEIVGGEIFLEGEDLLAMDEDQVRDIRGNKIAMIFQEPMTSLNPVLTIGRQIAEPIEIHQNVSKKNIIERGVELLRKVQIPDPRTRLDAYPHQFSGGMRQRAMIAMSLACEPKLIIADEPTTALDVTVQAQILELLQGLIRSGHSSMILITHDLGVVARYADRINVMYAGRIVEQGTARDIYNTPKHPYSIGLMQSVPRLDQDTREKLKPIEGQPPDLGNPPPGCPFHPRCSFAVGRCSQENPPLEHVGGEHWKACWIDVDAAN
jgi:oligopeptide transport system ATP-binding protein